MRDGFSLLLKIRNRRRRSVHAQEEDMFVYHVGIVTQARD